MSSPINEFHMTIGGALAPTERTLDVIDPATGAVLAEAPDCTPEDLDAAMDAATGAFLAWSRRTPSTRRFGDLRHTDAVGPYASLT